MQRLRLLLLGVLCCFVVVACGPKAPKGALTAVKGAKIKGRIVQDGQPFKALPMEEVQVTFIESGKDPKTAMSGTGQVKIEDGTFEIEGPTKQGIPAGKYKVALSSQIYGGDGTNRFEATLGQEKTTLETDVGANEGQTFVIDIEKKTVAKQ